MSWQDAVRGGVGADLNELGSRHGCAPLRWDLDSGVIGIVTDGDPDVAEKWAKVLGLDPVGADGMEYRGYLEDIPFTIRRNGNGS